MSDLHLQKCLTLNSSWTIVGTRSVQQALCDLAAGSFVGLDITDEYMVPTPWKDWVHLPIREGDDVVHTTKLNIRAPRVIVATRYKKVPVKRKQLNMKNLREHYDDTCAITGKKLAPKDCSKEHVTPQSLGGKNNWGNVVLCSKTANSKRGNLPYEKVGMTPPKIRPEPKPMPMSETIKNTYQLPEWDLLLKPKTK